MIFKGTARQRVKAAFYNNILRQRMLSSGVRGEKRAAQRASALREKGRVHFPRNRKSGT